MVPFASKSNKDIIFYSSETLSLTFNSIWGYKDQIWLHFLFLSYFTIIIIASLSSLFINEKEFREIL